MILYKEHFAHLNNDFGMEKHIIGLLKVGYTADELSEILKIEDEIIVQAINTFAKEQMNKITFNRIMEELGYDYEREETETSFG